MNSVDALALGGFLASVFLAALTGARFRPGAWYQTLRKPGFTPPNWVFAPAWTTLYILIAVAGWLAWRVAGWGAPLWLWSLSLVINASWSYVFFGRKRMGLGVAVIALLWLSIVAMMALFAPLSRAAALLLLPYLAWVSFAATLNLRIWQLNSGR